MIFNKFIPVSLATLCLINTTFCASASASKNPTAEQIENRNQSAKSVLDKTLKQLIANPERPVTGVSVVVVKNGKIVYDGNFGKRKLDQENPNKSLPVDKNTKFRIASISKLETATGIMQLVEQNKIDLDQDISKYLGFHLRNPSFPETPITVRMLLSHTSSIRDGDKYNFPPDETMQDALSPGGKNWANGAHFATPSEAHKEVAPGIYFEYSNLNYGLLGTIIEAVSGERFDKYMRAHVLLPLGCKASYNITDFNGSNLNQVSVLYRKRGKEDNDIWDTNGPWVPQADDYPDGIAALPAAAANYVPGKNASWLSPQGGLRISALDLSRVMRMFMNEGKFNGKQILKPETVKAMFTPQWTYDKAKKNGDNYDDLMICYGLGPQILTNTIGDRLVEKGSVSMVGHIGDANGLLSCLMMDFKTKDGFICILGGVGADPDKNKGRYSSFFRWEEEIATAVFKNYLQADISGPAIGSTGTSK